MTRDEIIDLLTIAAAYDRRTVGEADITAFHLALGNLPFEDAQQAVVAHYTNSPEWLMPAHIRALVRQARERRITRRPIPEPRPELTDDEAAYRTELGTTIRRMGDGHASGKELTTGRGSKPSAEYNRVRGADRDPVRVAAMAVPCPWPACQAAAGSACVDADGRRLAVPAHDGRLVTAGLAEWVEVNGIPRAVMRDLEPSS